MSVCDTTDSDSVIVIETETESEIITERERLNRTPPVHVIDGRSSRASRGSNGSRKTSVVLSVTLRNDDIDGQGENHHDTVFEESGSPVFGSRAPWFNIQDADNRLGNA